MTNRRLALAALLCLAASALPGTVATEGDVVPKGPERAVGGAAGVGAFAREALDRLPLAFEENRGQAEPPIRYLSRTPDATLFFTGRSAGFHLGSEQGSATVQLRPVGAAVAVPAAERPLAGRVSYLVGSDPEGWQTNLPTWGAVRYEGLWPGTDLLFYGTAGGVVEYDLELAPGADPSRIAFEVAGAEGLGLTSRGDLVIRTGAGRVTQRAPVVYQETGAGRRPVDGSFLLRGRRIGFRIGDHDPSLPLVIDPVIVLEHSSFLGGGGSDTGLGIAADGSGAAFVTGRTSSGTDFPITPGAHDASLGGTTDVFVTKVNPAGNALEFSTYIGGGDDETGDGIVIPSSGAPYVVGETSSTDFPVVAGAHDTTLGGIEDAFALQLDATGSALISSTFLGGGDQDEAKDVALDPSGAVAVFGETESGDFPTPGAPYDSTYNSPGDEDVFVAKLNAGLSEVVSATYLGGTARDFAGDNGIAVDGSGNVYVTGDAGSPDFPSTPGAFDTTNDGGDIYVAKLNAAGSALVFSTFLSEDDGEGVAVDATGAVYVTGEADPGFPTTAGAYDQTVDGTADGYITKLNPAGSALVYSTVIGGSGFEDVVTSVVVDASGRASIGGQTDSTDFPTTAGTHDPSPNGGTDGWVATVSGAGDALVASTYLGGGVQDVPEDVAVDPFGRLYVTGSTFSTDFPTASFDTTHGGASDGFVSRLGLRCPGLETRPGLHIVGTAADETLVGSEGQDLICADDGNDVVRGGGGADTVIGDDGVDRLLGGSGKDTLKGGNGKDTLGGGRGKDTLKGGKGKDTLRGQGGVDTLNGGSGADRCSPGPKSGRERSCER